MSRIILRKQLSKYYKDNELLGIFSVYSESKLKRGKSKKPKTELAIRDRE
jgi:hypothetical protein